MYKRQAQKEFNVLTTEVVNKQELTAQEEQKEESIYAGGVQSVPVSYTHLDVYKRQFLC